MGDTTLNGASGANILSLHQPSEYFPTRARNVSVPGSSGLQNSPSDFFTPSAVSNRASDLYRLQDAATSSIQLLDKANDAISRISELVDQAESIARNASALSSETANVTSSVTGLSGSETLEEAFGLDTSDTITIGGGVQSVSVSADSSLTVDGLIEAINSDKNLNVKASLSDGALKLEATGNNSITVSITDNAGDVNSVSDLGFTDAGGGVVADAGKVSLNRLSYANDFNAVLEEIDSVVRDAEVSGINLLRGDSLIEKFNANNIPTISVTGVDFDPDGLGINGASNGFQTSVDVLESISELDAARVTLENQSAIFNANRANISINQGNSSGLINALQSGTDLNISNPDEDVVGRLAEETQKLLSAEKGALTTSEDQEILKSIL